MAFHTPTLALWRIVGTVNHHHHTTVLMGCGVCGVKRCVVPQSRFTPSRLLAARFTLSGAVVPSLSGRAS